MVTVTFDPISVLKGLGVLLALAVVFFVVRGAWRGVRKIFAPKLEGMDRKAIRARWDEIERLVSSGEHMALKMAVLEADKLLDHALKAMAMSGNTLGERLKFAAYRYPNIREVWWAHRLRNSLAHEPTFRLEKHTAKRAIKEFERALRMLNVM
jgi:hypothetical protein